MELLVLEDELPELEPGLEVGLQCVGGHERLPLIGVERLLEYVDPELLLTPRQSGWPHDRAPDEVVVDGGALRLACCETRVGRGRRARGRECAEGSKLLRLIQLESLTGIVHRRDDAALVSSDGRCDGGSRRLA